MNNKINLAALFFTMMAGNSFAIDGKLLLQNQRDFYLCLAENSNESLIKKNLLIQRVGAVSDEEISKEAMAIDAKCSSQEITKVIEIYACFSKACKVGAMQYDIRQKMEEIKVTCKYEEQKLSISDSCKDSLDM